MDEKPIFSRRRDFFDWAKKKYPQDYQTAAGWARSLESAWRMQCARLKRDPSDTGDVCRTTPQTQAEAEESARYREESKRQAAAAKAMGAPFPESELASAWLAVCHNRAPDGRKFAD